MFNTLECIVARNDYANISIRHQPIELCVTILERVPSVVRKNEDLLRRLLDLTFKLMIDIDADIDQEWMTPREGFKVSEEEFEDDSVHFGKICVDRMVASVGEEKMLPLIGILVQNIIANDDDWRFKHAGLMVFSQVGEYVDDISKLSSMIPTVVLLFDH